MVEPLDKSMTQEAALLEKLTRIEENPTGCFAVHIHLSQLRPNNRQPHFINIAARAFDNLIQHRCDTLSDDEPRPRAGLSRSHGRRN
jgi:hypothetical protein